MPRTLARISFIALLSGAAFGQAPGAQKTEALPTFDIADVHVSPHSLRPNMQGGILRNGRYEIHTATMLDLIRTAYSIDADKVLSGPSWLDSDRFDVIAKAPPATPPETLKLMLQSLLADRFKLVFRRDTHPLPAFSLTVAKGGPKFKEADGSMEPGCRFTANTQEQIAKADAKLAAARAAATDSGNGGFAIALRPTYTYTCGSTSMAAFTEAMHTMPVAVSYFGTGIIVDQTGLKGDWDISFKYTAKPAAANANANATINIIDLGGDTIPLFEAVEKQLGLKLDPITAATPVIIVESVNRKPTDNPPGVTTTLPPPPATEFDVADIRLTEPGAAAVPSPGFQPSGRVDLRNYPLRSLVTLALNPATPDALVGEPKWLAAVRVDLIAKMPLTGGPLQQPVIEEYRPALLALLRDRFKFTYHIEDRPTDAYTLMAAKPKLKKTADPLIRTNCKEGPGADGKDPRTANPVNNRLVTCVNMTMAQFAEELPMRSGAYLRTDVVDATGIEGAYDFTLNFAPPAAANGTAGGRSGGDGGPGLGTPAATDPNGATSLFDALIKQLGLKLELEKRPKPVFVIDHLEPKPTEN